MPQKITWTTKKSAKMTMNKVAQRIKNRLSLRAPQTESLEILSNLVDKLELINHFLNYNREVKISGCNRIL